MKIDTSEEKIRIFIAVELISDIKEKLALTQNELKQSEADVKWVDPAHIHLTLKFIGNYPRHNLPKIVQIMEGTVKRIAPFKATFSNLGVFPHPESPRVVWVGVEEGKEELVLLNKEFENQLVQEGIAQEKRTFTPHLTLGRVRSKYKRKELAKKINNFSLGSIGQMAVKEISLMQSILDSRGARYSSLNRVRLGR